QIADIGIEGVLKKVDNEFIEAMDIRIGGHLGPEPRCGDVVVRKLPHYDLNAKLLEIFSLYEESHDEGETFRAFAERTPAEWWQERLAERAADEEEAEPVEVGA
ncbi:MAG: ferredoxin-nitrite reductase, partial [Solirubrobacteraceae bacterium]|nr:ferredoxin-nitrite reductase [Solirubrobacteraceae bacterium]